MTFYNQVPRNYKLVRNQLDTPEHGYRSLAATVIIQAIEDWKALCRKCAVGKAYDNPAHNFTELERFFTQYADTFVLDDGIDIRVIYKRLLAMRNAAMQKRKRLPRQGKPFGTWVQEERVKMGLSRTAFAKAVGMSMHKLDRIEGNYLFPSYEDRQAIENFVYKK